MNDEEEIARATARYPVADISPAEFEEFVAELLRSTQSQVTDLSVEVQDKITGLDGTYTIDVTVRFSLGGMDFLVLVEAKRHKNPIKRELVQVLHSKVQSVGAHKGAMISTAPYQRGALEYGLAHGIALATVTEGRFTFETKSVTAPPQVTRQQAREWGVPTFVAHAFSHGGSPTSIAISTIDAEHPEYVAQALLGISSAP